MNIVTRWIMRMKMPSAECVQVAEIIQQYLDGEGTEAEALEVEQHLGKCEACGFEAEQLQELREALRRHGRTADLDARKRLVMFADRLARGEIDTADEH